MVTIRKAEEKDRGAFMALEREFCEYYRESGFNTQFNPIDCKSIPESFFAKSFDQLISGDGFFFVAEADGEVVGCVEAEIVEPYEKELYRITKAGHINSVFVSREYRNKGIGTKLINEAMEWIKSQGIEICTLSVVTGNDIALTAYEKLGFRPERTKMWKQI